MVLCSGLVRYLLRMSWSVGLDGNCREGVLPPAPVSDGDWGEEKYHHTYLYQYGTRHKFISTHAVAHLVMVVRQVYNFFELN